MHKQTGSGIQWLVGAALAAWLAATPVAASQALQASPGSASNRLVAKKILAAKPVKAGRAGKRVVKRSVVFVEVAKPSFGHLYGLQQSGGVLDLKSSVALVIDQDTNEVLLSKNPHAVLPIASITKLMTALVVTEAGLPLTDMLTVTQDDVEATAGSSSRLKPGTQLTRGNMLHLALMSSENRAAHVLGRTYPGGVQPFVEAMNGKAQALGMIDTRYVEPTGLSSNNQSSAQDLARLVQAAYQHSIIRNLSTSPEAMMSVGSHQMQFRSTNGLVRSPEWEIGLQKTGYIAAAGRCLVMQAQMAGRKLIMVLLDSAGKYSRIGDAERIRKWVATAPLMQPLLPAAPSTASAVAAPAAALLIQAPR